MEWGIVPNDLEDYVDSKQAAQMLGVSDARVRQLIIAGTLPAIKVGGEGRRGSWLIKIEDIENYTPPTRGWPKGKRRKDDTQ
jgi:excisionase family DNA binding protein